MVSLPIMVEFSGGAELLFGNLKKLPLTLDDLPTQSDPTGKQAWTLKRLIAHLRDHHLKERPELFASGDTVRPGILVLVNDTDWELLGDKDYLIQANDNILFISTLHGG